jgi:ribonuclease HII
MKHCENELLQFVLNQTGFSADYIIAIDEVGRGCVAGPVVTCATVWQRCSKNSKQTWLSNVKDSKKLSSVKRLACFNSVLNDFNFSFDSIPCETHHTFERVNLVKAKSSIPFVLAQLDNNNINLNNDSSFSFECINFCLGLSSISEVEKFNIWGATQLAVGRSLLGLQKLLPSSFKWESVIILMDGNKPVSLPSFFTNILQVTAIKGDDLFCSVGLSSILAKVYRDTYMVLQEQKYPNYGFAKHKGYGTAAHLASIKKYGICDLHRLSFLKNYL